MGAEDDGLETTRDQARIDVADSASRLTGAHAPGGLGSVEPGEARERRRLD